MVTSRDLALPCLICLAEESNLGNAYDKVNLTSAQLHTKLQSRLRQHYKRKHKMGSRDSLGESLQQRAKLLVCRGLHSQPTDYEDRPSKFSREVRSIFLNVCKYDRKVNIGVRINSTTQ